MKLSVNRKIYHLLSFFFLGTFLYAQDISNVSFEMIDDDIHIYYTLTASGDQEFEISAVLKRLNDPSFSYIPENLSGDIDDDQYAGAKKTIVWDVTDEEFELFDGDDFYFEVKAEKITGSGGIPWYYFAGTAAVGGAVAAAVLLGGKDDGGGSSSAGFPSPPQRP